MTALISVLIAAAGAVTVAIWMPGRVATGEPELAAQRQPTLGAADAITAIGAVDA